MNGSAMSLNLFLENMWMTDLCNKICSREHVNGSAVVEFVSKNHGKSSDIS